LGDTFSLQCEAEGVMVRFGETFGMFTGKMNGLLDAGR